ncbi:efflux RND transporter periplasmic adaptor subunit [Piscinibacter koreensis]|uniref:Efflux RND transporter periplasmic adaptor subunit n=1 Tax=Piscinibacter koreensis TaxID=2742824 RepID=A0A7Y6NJP8_9BURK|nr:efflux RND transporter periplasmic adaptor subunit [Schlegelella koreensis]NUZ04364.1 efflux RND transporter periplasmic adaptor subunit [Schlegelella koreensis]
MIDRRRAGIAALLLTGTAALLPLVNQAAEPKRAAAPRPALSVTLIQPQPTVLARRIPANGNIAAWQEASVGTEANGLRLAEVHVNVGDVVKKGQVLATFAADTTLAQVAQIRAAVVEAEATAADAAANAERARGLQSTGALSESVINQYLTAERTAKARLEAQRAAARAQQLRLGQTRVLAPDNGVISARSATVGAVLPAGQELFRLIRKGRLEWRAEVPASDLATLRPGTRASITPAGGTPIPGTVRVVAPTVDPQTRNGLVYVDLPAPGSARAGMFARGEFEVGSSNALTLPQSAVQMREGFSYVWRVDAESKVRQTKVEVGRRAGDRIEVIGLDPNVRVVESGVGFLGDGDLVRVVDRPAAAASGAATPRAAPRPGTVAPANAAGTR